MAVAFRAASTANGNGNTFAVAAPSGLVISDVMLFLATHYCDPTPPSGLTVVDGINTGTGGPFPVKAVVYYKVAVSADVGATFTFNFGCNDQGTLLCLAYSGVDTVAPVHKHAVATSSSGATSFTGPTVTTTINGCMLIDLFAAEGGGSTNSVTVGAGLTSRAADHPSQYNAAGAGDESQSTAGASTARAATSGLSSSWAAYTVALSPPVPYRAPFVRVRSTAVNRTAVR